MYNVLLVLCVNGMKVVINKFTIESATYDHYKTWNTVKGKTKNATVLEHFYIQ